MQSPHIDQVRQCLLDTLADLRNKVNPMDIERAKAVATVASVLVDTAKVENEYLKLSGQDRSNFLEASPDGVPEIPRVDGPAAHNPFPNVVRHRLQG
jgi:hypothetical protein